ncbi:hypothetical protein ERX46_11575 [Brumimicrobium glaciale]|uniref:DUF4199 domain-containing protein n=1 Tax=Brumimicrobium glaciale TaxID=200475 RepID=A0A4Q4KKY8_9FLAO|nr:hypothetical protein [Brumimicrobium glaciale]RYM33570.1 hypothetical protein ERX46_11575 [Brumimicrobium glaciale]
MLKRTNAIRNGLLLFAILGLYFLLLDALGWADNLFLRLGNYVFIFLMVNNTLKSAVKNGENYLSKLAVGIVTVFIAMTLGAISLFIYLQVLEPDLERYISPVIAANSYSGLCVALFIQSLASSMILVFILSQLYKNKKPSEMK